MINHLCGPGARAEGFVPRTHMWPVLFGLALWIGSFGKFVFRALSRLSRIQTIGVDLCPACHDETSQGLGDAERTVHGPSYSHVSTRGLRPQGGRGWMLLREWGMGVLKGR